MSIPSWCHAGAKVACVVGGQLAGSGRLNGVTLPVAGTTYTVRNIHADSDGVFIRLVEIVNAPRQYVDGFEEVCFKLSRFRPLITRTQADDIELFRPLLNPSLDELAERNRRQGEEIDAQLERLRSAIRFNNAVEAA